MERYFRLFLCMCVFLGSTGCDVQAISEFVHTSTPTVTSTPLPTSTPKPTSTPEPTATVYLVPTANPVSQVTMKLQDDHTWLVTDQEAGYEYQIGGLWYLDDVSTMDVMEIITGTMDYKERLGLSYPPQMFIEPDGMRILGIYRDDSITDYSSLAFNSSHIVDAGLAERSLDEVNRHLVTVLADNYDYTADDFGIAQFTNEYGVEISHIAFTLAHDYYHMKIVFKLDDGIGMMTLGFSNGNYEIIQHDLMMIVGSIRLLESEEKLVE